MKSCMQMPITPSTAIAKPTSRGGMPRPPVNTKGRWRGVDGGATGVERKTYHRLLKVPRWVAMRLWAMSVQITL